MKYLSVCSGIEAATVAWHDLGWEAAAFSEIEAFPSAVLAHRYPDVPNLGDMTKYKDWNLDKIDLLVGGTPCQSFSVAGLRKGLDDPRGNLMLTFLAIAERQRPRWVVWENVPGVLSSAGGRDFGTFLAALGQLGYGWAYRVLDAQWFGVAQRRRRVFVVGCLGDATRAAKVLFERESVCRNPAPSREKRQDAAADAGSGAESDSEIAEAFVPETCGTITAGMHKGPRGTEAVDSDWLVQSPSHWDNPNAPHPTLNQSAAVSGGVGSSNQEIFSQRGAYLVPGQAMPFDTTQITSPQNYSNPQPGDPCHPLAAGAHIPAVAYAIQGAATRENPSSGPDGVGVRGDDCAYTIEARSEVQAVAFQSSQSGVRVSDTHATLDANNGSRRHNGVVAPTTQYGDIAGSLTARHDSSPCADRGQNVVTAYTTKLHNTSSNNAGKIFEERTTCLDANSPPPALLTAMQVRRLTPVECERLQGFPDNYTNIPWRKKDDSPDGPRYKALGNSMAVPVMRWIGQRIAEVEKRQ